MNVGDQFNSWHVLEVRAHRRGDKWMANCRCDCGKESLVRHTHLKSGESKSCGCKRTVAGNGGVRRGDKYHRLYPTWQSMLQRCLNKTHPSFHHYGGRGITVCERWKKFRSFLDDMLDTYAEGLSIDRIDNNQGYSKENCRWATPKEQSNNQRKNKVLSYDGKSMTISQWSEHLNIPRKTISERLKRGWSVAEALTRAATAKSNGVGWHKHAKAWRARIRINGKDKHLGFFTDQAAAAAAVMAARNEQANSSIAP